MTDTVVEERPASSPGSRHLGWALVLICIAQLMVVLDATIANIALPFIRSDLHIGEANLQWIVTGYSLAFGGLLLLGGRLGDLYGRRRIFMIGVSVFAVASALGGLAQNEALLLGARGLQGLGAALASPTALALITTNFPAGPQRNRAFSVYAAISGVGAAIGLILGGWLTGLTPDLLGTVVDGWRLTFLINVPIGLVAAVLAPVLLSESESHPGELDIPGALTGTLGLVALVFGLSRAGQQQYGWGDPSTIVTLIAGVALLGLFVLVESRVKHPLLPFRILLSRTRATAFVAMMIVPAAMFAMFFFLSLFVQNVMGFSSLRTGFAFLPFSFGIIVSATLASKLMERVDPRWLSGAGTVLAGFGLLGFSRLHVSDSAAAIARAASGSGALHLGSDINYWASIFPFVVLMSFGMGLVFVPMTLAAVHGVDHRDSGIGSGVLNTMQQVGGALGLATLATVAVHFTQSKAADIATSLKAAGASGSGGSGSGQARFEAVLGQAAFSNGASHAFLTGAIMIWVATVIVVVFLNVKHEELATDEVPEGVAV